MGNGSDSTMVYTTPTQLTYRVYHLNDHSTQQGLKACFTNANYGALAADRVLEMQNPQPGDWYGNISNQNRCIDEDGMNLNQLQFAGYSKNGSEVFMQRMRSCEAIVSSE